MNVTLEEADAVEIGNGTLGEVPHWRLVNVTPQCFVSGAQ